MKTLSFDPIRADVAITEKEKSAALHANALLHNGQGAGNDFLGWVGLPSALGEEELQAIETEAARLRDLAEVILCIGIGGSYLGARAVYEALSDPFNLLHEHPAKPILLFAGQNLSEDYLARLLAAVENRSIAAIVISKSGTTTEPAIAFRLIKAEIEKRYGKKEAAERIVAITPHQRGEQFEELPVERFETHTRAFIKVEDGCNRQCAYCVIPRARGPVRSRAEESILAELHQLAAAGYREVVLSAISLPSYGLDTGTNLVELVEKCAQVPGIERIRLGSLDPDMLTPEFISRLAAVDKLCPQFHLSLQSGCTATLRRMRRVYTAQEYAQVVEQIRAAYGSRPVSFTTDCICGFPGETAKDFEESCAFLKKIGFLKVHVFPYSRRSGTPAYDFPDQIHEREKQERSRRMNAVAEQVRCEALAAFEGTEDEVLLETPLSGTLFTGYTRLYIPVVVSAPGCESGQIVRVKLGRYDGERVRAALC